MLQKGIKPEDLLSSAFEGQFFLSLRSPLPVDKKQHIEIPKAESVPVFTTCEVEPGRQHKPLALLDLEVNIPKSLEVLKFCGKYPMWDHCTFSFQCQIAVV